MKEIEKKVDSEIKTFEKNQEYNIDKPKSKVTFLRLVQYFIIYSIIGLIIETFFGLIIEGVIESRKNFLYGPFSCIYGLGGVLMTLALQRFSKNRYTLFFGGVLVGSALEYGISLFGELIYNVKWWDYSGIPFNINGRVCLLFSIIWGLLAIYFVSYFQPKVDKLLDKINKKFLNITTIVIMVFMIINFFVTSFALEVFFARVANEHQLDLKDNSQVQKHYNEWCKSETFKYITDTAFPNEKMLKTFPNLRITLVDDTVMYVRDLYPDIQPYYFRVFKVPLKNAIDNVFN